MLCCWPEEYVTKCCWLNLKNSVSAFLWFIHCFILGVHSHFWGVQPHDCWTWHQKWKFGEGLVSNRYSEDYKIIPSKSPMPLQVGKKPNLGVHCIEVGSQDPSHVRLSRGEWNSPTTSDVGWCQMFFRMHKLWFQKLPYLQKVSHWIGFSKKWHTSRTFILPRCCPFCICHALWPQDMVGSMDELSQRHSCEKLYEVPSKRVFAWPSQYIPVPHPIDTVPSSRAPPQQLLQARNAGWNLLSAISQRADLEPHWKALMVPTADTSMINIGSLRSYKLYTNLLLFHKISSTNYLCWKQDW